MKLIQNLHIFIHYIFECSLLWRHGHNGQELITYKP